MKGARRTAKQAQPQQQQGPSSASYEGFDMMETSSQAYQGQYYSNYAPPGYEQSPQLFEDTSSQFAPQIHPNNYYEQQQVNENYAPNMNMYGLNPGIGGPNLMNQQIFMAAGQQLLTNPMATAAFDQYSQQIVDKGKSWIGQNLKYYFAVDTAYVLKKLLLIFFPFTHKDWSIRYNTDEQVAPRDDVNAPDLYIPSMAFVTYVLLSGYLFGLQNRFSPEQIGIQASFAMAWVLLEVLLVITSLYLMSISCSLGFLHLVAFGGYKFVCIVASLLVSLPFSHLGYYSMLGYCSLSLGFFLMRSLHIAIQSKTGSQRGQSSESRNGVYLVMIICLWQPLIMYFLTKHLALYVLPKAPETYTL